MLRRIVIGLIVLLAAVWLVDWALVRLRGLGAQGSVTVESGYVIHQKNGKLEYLYDGPQPAPCVRSLFPHLGEPPCWYLARHPEQLRQITAN